VDLLSAYWGWGVFAIGIILAVCLPIMLWRSEPEPQVDTAAQARRGQAEAATALRVSVDQQADLGGGVKLDLVLVPAGSFSMGSDSRLLAEDPVHQVTFAKPFYMGKTEVTQRQWESIMGTNPSRFKGQDNPVEAVSWNASQEFIKKLNEKTGRKFSLPSEAEWEWACRAGAATRFCFGDSDASLGDYAWYSANSSAGTHPVGEKRANGWGLHDMHGNVWEWCVDIWHQSYEGAPADGSAWTERG